MLQTLFEWPSIEIGVLRHDMYADITVIEPRKLQQLYREQTLVSWVYSILSSIAKVSSTQMDWSASILFLSLTARTTRSATSLFYLVVRMAGALDDDFKLRHLQDDKAQRWFLSCSTFTTYFDILIKSTLYYRVVVSFSSTLSISSERLRQRASRS